MFSFLVANIIRFMIKPIQSICLRKYFECLFVCVFTYGSVNIVMFILAYHTFPGKAKVLLYMQLTRNKCRTFKSLQLQRIKT